MDCVIEDPRWQALALEDTAARALQVTLAHLGVPDHAEVSLLGCDDARIAVLNADFREKPTATNVLSWPSEDLAPADPGAMPVAPTVDFDGSLALGDIAISYDTCMAEAGAAGIPAPHHVTHLLVHGILHLLGYDHIRDPDATLMERTEVEILGKMGIDDPYCLSQAE